MGVAWKAMTAGSQKKFGNHTSKSKAVESQSGVGVGGGQLLSGLLSKTGKIALISVLINPGPGYNPVPLSPSFQASLRVGGGVETLSD